MTPMTMKALCLQVALLLILGNYASAQALKEELQAFRTYLQNDTVNLEYNLEANVKKGLSVQAGKMELYALNTKGAKYVKINRNLEQISNDSLEIIIDHQAKVIAISTFKKKKSSADSNIYLDWFSDSFEGLEPIVKGDSITYNYNEIDEGNHGEEEKVNFVFMKERPLLLSFHLKTTAYLDPTKGDLEPVEISGQYQYTFNVKINQADQALLNPYYYVLFNASPLRGNGSLKAYEIVELN